MCVRELPCRTRVPGSKAPSSDCVREQNKRVAERRATNAREQPPNPKGVILRLAVVYRALPRAVVCTEDVLAKARSRRKEGVQGQQTHSLRLHSRSLQR